MTTKPRGDAKGLSGLSTKKRTSFLAASLSKLVKSYFFFKLRTDHHTHRVLAFYFLLKVSKVLNSHLYWLGRKKCIEISMEGNFLKKKCLFHVKLFIEIVRKSANSYFKNPQDFSVFSFRSFFFSLFRKILDFTYVVRLVRKI